MSGSGSSSSHPEGSLQSIVCGALQSRRVDKRGHWIEQDHPDLQEIADLSLGKETGLIEVPRGKWAIQATLKQGRGNLAVLRQISVNSHDY